MVEFVVGGLIAIFLLVCAIALPLLLVAGLLKFVIWVVVLPFRLLGALFGAVVGVIGAVSGLLLGGVALVAGLLLIVGLALAVPLLPLVIIAGIVALFVRAIRPRANRTMHAA